MTALAYYWVNTSGNGILRALLEKADAQRIEALQTLLDGDTIQVTLNERVIYEDIGRDKSALYTILLLTPPPHQSPPAATAMPCASPIKKSATSM